MKVLTAGPTLNWKVPPTKILDLFVSHGTECVKIVKIHSALPVDIVRAEEM
jgi:hypothetical protein